MNDNQWSKKEKPMQGMGGLWGGVGSNLVSGDSYTPTAWEAIAPSWFPRETSTPKPYAWYDMENRNSSTGISGNNPQDRTGNNRHMTGGVAITRTTCTGQELEGSHDCFTFNNGTSKVKLIDGWPGVTAMSWIHMTSYLSSGGSNGRIWDCNNEGSGIVNWFVGHHTDRTGIAFYGAFLNTNDELGRNFGVHFGYYSDASTYEYRWKKTDGTTGTYSVGGTGAWPASNTGVCINNGPYGEQSDGKCIFFGTWDSVLNNEQRDAVMDAAYGYYLDT